MRVNQLSSTFLPAIDSGSTMFSRAVSVGTRLNAWKTNPTRSRRSSVKRLSVSCETSVSPKRTVPEVGESSAASMCINVDLPEPDGPMMAVNSPALTSKST